VRDKVGKFYRVGENEQGAGWASGRDSKQSQVFEAMERGEIYRHLQ